jgi:chromosome segregation ATPase
MMRKLVIFGLLIVAGLYLAKRTSFGSYAGTVWSQVASEAKRQVPTKFEIDRARHEIASMNRDISNMLHPIAEYMATVKRLERDVEETRAALSEQKARILAVANDVKENPRQVSYQGASYSGEELRRHLQRDFDCYKRSEAHLRSQEQLLAAKRKSLEATREQLSKLIAKKREFEVRLAQLEADEEILEIAKIGSNINVDDGRATQIENALAQIEHRQEVVRSELELVNGPLGNQLLPPEQRRNVAEEANVEDILNYFDSSSNTVRK